MNYQQLELFFQRAMKPIKDRLYLIAGKAIIKAVNDGAPIQELRISALAGEAMDRVARMQEFGFSSNPPAGSEGIILALGANRENLVMIATENRNVRIKNLASGEMVIYTDDGTYLHLKKSGQVELKTAVKTLIDCPLVEMTGDLLVKGNTEIDGTLLVKDDVTFDKNLLVKINAIVQGILGAGSFTGATGGPVTSTQNITTTANVIGGGTDLATVKSTFNAHVHNENDNTPPGATTTAPTTGV